MRLVIIPPLTYLSLCTALLTQWGEELGRLMLMRNQNIAERARGMMPTNQGSQHTAMQMAQAAQAAAAQAAQGRPPLPPGQYHGHPG